ncbi:bifunctional riboflavin kinase/FAD synthetase [Jannaschia aquimarina]|uniref:Riboflavin biosynthesis protein n=1 Tax=Jannaschia aquimarina TaxID=935700 RepID=A0A0D1EQF1_9RHOB|nr:bifunctional riboflavin kinase/FAD synthetase [Jannaschia aquimarina]KIT17815.1 Riboflavin biosynthesis protein RibF [Jannaschia aquimarina]SNS90917.1 FMN adenylyltransferase /riboflavin kinase [Jannaschia aquimarina]
MHFVRDPAQLSDALRGASAAIGNFDGVHLGHRHVIDLARRDGAPLGVMTFEPHPREVFAPDGPPFRLMNPAAKASRLAKIGVDVLFELDFRTIAPLTAEAFMSEIIARDLGLSRVVVGADFRFGKGRAGDVEALQAGGAAHGFDVTVADLIEGPVGEVSSTAIRSALTEGRPRDAAAMLGHWHRIEGPVIHGEKRGRTLGWPTANMALDGLHLPQLGVYAVLVDILSGPHAGARTGVASLGVRPMFGENRPNLETFLFDFDGDLYGAPLSVALVEFLRPEERFDGLDALIAQMERDGAAAREVLVAL